MRVHLTSVMSFPPETSHKPQWAQLYTAFQLEKSSLLIVRHFQMNTSQFEYFERDTFRSSEIKCSGHREWEGDTYIGEGNWHVGTDTNYFYHIPFICLSLAVMDPRNASKTANVPIPLIIGWLSYLCWSGKPEQQCSKHVFSDITAVNTAITGSDLTVF